MNEDAMKKLENLMEKLRDRIQRNSYSKSVPLARFYDEQKLEMLEAIHGVFKTILERLEKTL
jgi:hypothetical protein